MALSVHINVKADVKFLNSLDIFNYYFDIFGRLAINCIEAM